MRKGTIKWRICDKLTQGQTLTAMQLHALLPDIQLASLSGCLTKISQGKKRLLQRVEKFGPRGGRGYRLRTLTDMIVDEATGRIAADIAQEIDRQILAEIAAEVPGPRSDDGEV